jgi:hypothetical protein
VLSQPHLDSSQLEESGIELTELLAWVALDVIEDHSRKATVRGRNGYHQYITTRESYGPWIAKTVENVLAYMPGNPVRVQNPEAMAKSR